MIRFTRDRLQCQVWTGPQTPLGGGVGVRSCRGLQKSWYSASVSLKLLSLSLTFGDLSPVINFYMKSTHQTKAMTVDGTSALLTPAHQSPDCQTKSCSHCLTDSFIVLTYKHIVAFQCLWPQARFPNDPDNPLTHDDWHVPVSVYAVSSRNTRSAVTSVFIAQVVLVWTTGAASKKWHHDTRRAIAGRFDRQPSCRWAGGTGSSYARWSSIPSVVEYIGNFKTYAASVSL